MKKITIITNAFANSHEGHKPSPSWYGGWFFAIDGDKSNDSLFQFTGKYGEAVKAASRHAHTSIELLP